MAPVWEAAAAAAAAGTQISSLWLGEQRSAPAEEAGSAPGREGGRDGWLGLRWRHTPQPGRKQTAADAKEVED